MADLAKKLLLKPGQRAVILNAPAGYREMLEPLPEGVKVLTQPAGQADWVQLFAGNKAELEGLARQALAAARPGAVLWIAYPKKSSGVVTDITRDTGWESLRSQGWRPVTQIAIDDVWSALRFRPAAEVR